MFACKKGSQIAVVVAASLLVGGCTELKRFFGFEDAPAPAVQTTAQPAPVAQTPAARPAVPAPSTPVYISDDDSVSTAGGSDDGGVGGRVQ